MDFCAYVFVCFSIFVWNFLGKLCSCLSKSCPQKCVDVSFRSVCVGTYVYTLSEGCWSSCGCCRSRCVPWCRARSNPPSQPTAAKTGKEEEEEEEEEVKVMKREEEEEDGDRMEARRSRGVEEKIENGDKQQEEEEED